MHIEQCAHVHISSYWEGMFLLPLLPFASFAARSVAMRRDAPLCSSLALHVKIHFGKIIYPIFFLLSATMGESIEEIK